MISKDKLKNYAKKLMFDMNDEEYETLQQEFEVIIKQMDLIGEIKDIDKVEPMSFPFVTYNNQLRSDIVDNELTTEEVLANAKKVSNNEVKVPKVVE